MLFFWLVMASSSPPISLIFARFFVHHHHWKLSEIKNKTRYIVLRRDSFANTNILFLPSLSCKLLSPYRQRIHLHQVYRKESPLECDFLLPTYKLHYKAPCKVIYVIHEIKRSKRERIKQCWYKGLFCCFIVSSFCSLTV